MKTLTIKKARQLIRKNKPNTERMFEAMKGWPFRVRLSLAVQLLIGWKKRRGMAKKKTLYQETAETASKHPMCRCK